MGDQRVGEIDGLRGWAALSVVVFHMLQQTFAGIMPGVCINSIWILMDGPMAVYIFFILSGDAISWSHISNPIRHALDRVIAKRYLRLTIPVLITVLFTYGLMKTGHVYNQPASQIVHRHDWLGMFLVFPADIMDALNYAFTLVVGSYRGQHIWNDFLWTMPVEMYGSLLVFGYLHFIHRLRWPAWTSLGIFVGFSCLNAYYGLFFLGVFFGQMRAAGILERLRRHYAGWLAGAALLCGAYCFEYFAHRYAPPKPGVPGFGPFIEWAVYYHRQHIMAVMIVAGSYVFTPAIWLLRSFVSRSLGRVSFAIYLAQFPLICSVESYLIIRYQDHLTSMNWVLALAGMSVLSALVVAEVITRLDNFVLGWISAGLNLLFMPKAAAAPATIRAAATVDLPAE